MTIRRSPRREHYVTINQAVFDDERLDHRALGVLTYLLSKPDNWQTSSHQLSTRFQCNITTMKTILAGLEQIGYLKREKHRKPDGTFTWESTIFETPTMGQKTSDGKTSDGKTSDGKTSDGKLAHITNTDSTKTELTKTDQDQDEADFSAKANDPFYNGFQKAIAKEIQQRQINGVKNFITDAPWGQLAEETGKDPLTVFQQFEQFLIAKNSDKQDPDAYAKKIANNLFQNPGSEHACKPWIEFADFFRKNLFAPPPPQKRQPRQPQITQIPDRDASRRAFQEAKRGIYPAK